ncbi:TNT domain-containing protein [Streptomyces sp. FIT100]|uniref:TNT domain-containing protein n=1 Tax=Streptomyces sp. FIT100 TaxID=2837956 RepID=UPI0021C7F9BE|nr:TNT domain-containing protein [Streptomyces sp. FIT100]UUN31596.1 glycohydrolase toxin TNT-related protein [Streptomyces sp. FIT100]
MGLTAALAAAPTAQAAPAEPVGAAAAPADCTGAFEGDKRLGPEHLPGKRQRPVGPLLDGYDRTGKLSPAAFLKEYWEGPAGAGRWKYPPNDGFAEVNGVVDKAPELLAEGERLDRFGSESGSYLAPAGDPYAERALPPQNLNTRDAAFPCDYHMYEVIRPFVAWQGSIAPWFEQPGGGHQIMLDPAFLDPGEGRRLNVMWLLDHGYLVRLPA